MNGAPLAARAGRLLPLAALMLVITVADTLTRLEIAFGVFHVAAVLIAAWRLDRRTVIGTGAAGVALTLLSFLLTPARFTEAGWLNLAISVIAIAAATWLALRLLAATAAVHEARAELARIARVTLLGELTASIAHEVNQPLAAMSTSAAACRRWLAAQPPNLPRAAQALARIEADAARASEVVARVRGLVRREPPCKTWINLADLVTDTLALCRAEVDAQRVVPASRLDEGVPPVLGDRVQLQQVLLNLVLNALDAMQDTPPEARVLRIEVTAAGAREVAVAVIDAGRGLAVADAERLFEAFFTTKPAGMGIGLTLSRGIVEAHGGRITAEPRPQGGAIVRFVLPAAGAA